MLPGHGPRLGKEQRVRHKEDCVTRHEETVVSDREWLQIQVGRGPGVKRNTMSDPEKVTRSNKTGKGPNSETLEGSKSQGREDHGIRQRRNHGFRTREGHKVRYDEHNIVRHRKGHRVRHSP